MTDNFDWDESQQAEESLLGSSVRGPRNTYTFSATSVRVVGVLAAFVLVLLLASTAMLWKIADQTSGGAQAGSAKSSTAEPPPLPAETHRGTSSKALLSEVDNLSKKTATPLNELNTHLAQLGDGGAGAIRSSVERSNRVFAGVSGNLGQLVSRAKRLGKSQKSLQEVAKSTQHLASLQGSLKNLNKNVGVMDDVNGNTSVMNNNIQTMIQLLNQSNAHLHDLGSLSGQLDTFNQTMTQINTTMQRINGVFNALCVYIKGQPSSPDIPPDVCP